MRDLARPCARGRRARRSRVSTVLVAALAAGGSVAAIVLGIGRFLADRPEIAARGAARGGPLSRRPAGRRLGAQLQRAGIAMGPDAFAAVVAGLAACAGVLGLAVIRTPVAAAAGAVAVIAGAVALVRSADRRHLRRVERQLPGVAQQLAAAIHAGLSLRQALARAARDAPEPIRAELERAVGELALGGRLEGALEGLALRLPAHDLRIMVTAILVQRRTGGDLARALADLSGRMEERAQLERELRGSTAQARMTAWLVAALPVAGAAMAELAAPGTLVRILGSGPGPALLVVSTTLYGVGLLWIRRIGRVEP